MYSVLLVFGIFLFSALRGDLPNIDEKWEYDPNKFNFATDLVRHIRSVHKPHL